MSIAPNLFKVACLVLLLTWFSFRAINPQAEMFDRALVELGRFMVIDSSLYRDVFTARIGALRNYDPLVREIKNLRSTLERLRSIGATDTRTTAAIDRLAGSIDRQEELVELFKTENAMLHNSLSFLGRFSMRSISADLDPTITASAAAILQLTLDTSTATARDVQDHLDELDRQAAQIGQRDSVEAFLAHGRLLRELLPSVDNTLSQMRKIPRKQNQDALRAIILERQLASRNSARNFRMLLYGTSLLLVLLLIDLGVRLRSRARVLQRRAALEHVIAQISMRFINAGPQHLDAEIDRSLVDLAAHSGSDRVYLVLTGPTSHVHIWHRPDKPPPPAWPELARELAGRIEAAPDGVVHVPRVCRMPAGATRDKLEDLGIGGWACVQTVDYLGRTATLGFDAVGRPCRFSNAGELALLRMALDTFVHAVERNAVENERKRLEARLQQARRMETIGTFTSGIAHNFNNILGGILGHSEVMEGHVGSNAKLVGNLGAIRRSAERAQDLVSHILAFGRSRDMRRKPVSVSALMAETASLLRVSLSPQIELIIRQTPAATIVIGEHAQLQQVILNLSNNAAQAMGDGGRIEIATELRDVREATSLSQDEIAPGQFVCIAVTDTGTGIDEATLGRIFEPFFTTRPSGNGLGLATVREIVHDHGGGMNVLSKPGEGSRFEVWLPRASAAVSLSEPDAAALPTGTGEVVMLVVADHDNMLRDEEMLAALGYEPVGFATAEAALAACKANAGRFDAAVIGKSGSLAWSLELATALHKSAPRLPVLLAINSAIEIGAEALLAAGVCDVVSWPIAAEEIAIALAQNTAWSSHPVHSERRLLPSQVE
jgi:signal transduction histidine kinase